MCLGGEDNRACTSFDSLIFNKLRKYFAARLFIRIFAP